MNNLTELGLPNFIRTIFWIVAFYYGAKFLFKWWLKRKISSHTQHMNSSVDQTEAEYRKKAEGHVSIKQEPKSSATPGKSSDTDYVDFEEVD
jgi:hypothetical protein